MNMIVNQDPFRSMRLFHNEIHRLFDRDEAERCSMMTPWPVRVDIHEEADQILLQADLPGMTQKDIGIHLENNQLTISGERPQEDATQREHCFRRERPHGAFRRSFQLGSMTDPENIRASYKNGVLTVSLPKKEEAKPRTIKVQVA